MNEQTKPDTRHPTPCRYIVVKRNYHGQEQDGGALPWTGIRWVVGLEGETRGICECWDEASAARIAQALNARHQASGVRNQVSEIAALIADDSYAITFQTMGQYRSALIKACFQTLEPSVSSVCSVVQNLPGIGNGGAE